MLFELVVIQVDGSIVVFLVFLVETVSDFVVVDRLEESLGKVANQGKELLVVSPNAVGLLIIFNCLFILVLKVKNKW